jgi:hypothetical protein
MEDGRYIIFEVLIEYEVNGEKKYNATSLSDFMNGKSIEECEEIAKQFCRDMETKYNNRKWIVCGYNVVDITKKLRQENFKLKQEKCLVIYKNTESLNNNIIKALYDKYDVNVIRIDDFKSATHCCYVKELYIESGIKIDENCILPFLSNNKVKYF